MNSLHKKPAKSSTINSNNKHSLIFVLKEFWEYRSLLVTLTIQHIAARYKQSLLGVSWIWLQPILTTTIFAVMFGLFARFPSDELPYAVFAISGVVSWGFISRLFLEGSQIFLTYSIFIEKVYCPRLMLPLVPIFSATADFLISIILVILLALIYDVPIPWTIILVPFIIIFAGFFSYSWSLALAPLTAIYRDANFFVPFLMQSLMFASAVFFPTSFVPAKYGWVMEVNPFATIVITLRWAMVGGTPPTSFALACFAAATLFFLSIGFKIFYWLEPKVLDSI